MIRYILRRLGYAFLVVIAAMTAMFLIGHVIGDPVTAIVSEFATEEVREALRTELGYNDPLPTQFGRFVIRVVTVDFGLSPVRNQDAMGLVLKGLRGTVILSLGIMALSIPIGLALGTAGAMRPGGVFDRIGNVLALAGVSIVEFWLGLTLIIFVAIPFSAIPTGGSSTASALLLPAVAGAFRFSGRIAQFSRSAFLEEYGKPYVEMVRAKGASERLVFKHVAKNAGIPIVTLLGDELIGLMNGIVVLEVVFGWPGIGRIIVQSVLERDLVVLEAAIFVLVVIVTLGNLLIDVTYAALNPKVRYE